MADAKRMIYGAPLDITIGTSFTSTVLDAAGEIQGFIFQADEAATIHTLMVRQTAKTGTGGTFKIGLQGVSATGYPDGTYITGTGGEASATLTLGSDATILKQVLDHDLDVTRGAWYAMVVECVTGDGSNNTSFARTLNIKGQVVPYPVSYLASTWAKYNYVPIFGYSSTSKVYGWPVQLGGGSGTAAGAGEIGFSFTIPTTYCSTYKILGLGAAVRWLTAGSSAVIRLYDTDGTTVLQAITVDTDYIYDTASGMAQFTFDEASLSTLSAGSTYYIAISRGAADSASLYLTWLQVATAADWDAFGAGQDFAIVSRAGVGSGAWTTDATKRPLAELILSDWTLAAAGSGIIRNNMSGGLIL